MRVIFNYSSSSRSFVGLSNILFFVDFILYFIFEAVFLINFNCLCCLISFVLAVCLFFCIRLKAITPAVFVYSSTSLKEVFFKALVDVLKVEVFRVSLAQHALVSASYFLIHISICIGQSL